MDSRRAHKPDDAKPADPVFPDTKGGLMRHQQFYKRGSSLRLRGRCPRRQTLRFHDLRHTCAALLIVEGAHPKEIAERLEHSIISITMDTYGHIFPSRDAALAAALDGVLRAARPRGAAAA